MKKLIWLAILLPMVANAQSAVTVGGTAACLTEQLLDDFITYAVSKDIASMQALMDRNHCIVLKSGLRVTIVDAGWTKHQFAYQGIKLWTVAEGLKIAR